MTNPAPSSRPPLTRRSLAVVVAVAVLIAAALLVGGLFGSGAEPGEALASPSSTRTSTGSARPPVASRADRDPETGLRWAELSSLPRQVADTVELIQQGGPFPYAKDGVTFRNDERVLPAQRRGYYHEYTVRTPGEGDRGARRVVTGDDDREFFYTDDHYASFVRIRQ